MCKHYWKIETPDGEFSEGVCRYCGESRTFRNWPKYERLTGPERSHEIHNHEMGAHFKRTRLAVQEWKEG